jgi:hypothetical protein
MYFDPYKVQLGVSNEEVLVDGAIIAENPSLYASVFSKEFNPPLTSRDYVRVVSLGSGFKRSFYGKTFESGNFLGQIFAGADDVIDLFSYIKAQAHAHFTKLLVGAENYYRFDVPLLEDNTNYADGSSIPYMYKIGAAMRD